MLTHSHVKSIHYRIITGEHVDYKKASPIREETDDFVLRVENDLASFEMKKHFSTKEDAKDYIDPYLKRWEILIGLAHDHRDLRFEYKNAEVIDRSPDDKNSIILNVDPIRISVSLDAVLHVSRGRFPSPPKNFENTPDVETMYLRYKAFREGKESLLAMAYMCLTVLETSAGGRSKAVSKYSISKAVLNKLGTICSEKGGKNQDRKAPKKGAFDVLTASESEWVIQVVKALIRRVGEYAYRPTTSLQAIIISDFPPV
ncbi:MAG: hypothetical protein Q7J27_12330 [Syntrophales bacterium]|nr:hypothetical protein [Syntrophales bacterium]